MCVYVLQGEAAISVYALLLQLSVFNLELRCRVYRVCAFSP